VTSLTDDPNFKITGRSRPQWWIGIGRLRPDVLREPDGGCDDENCTRQEQKK